MLSPFSTHTDDVTVSFFDDEHHLSLAKYGTKLPA